MRVLVTGVRGQLGYDVVQELTRRNHEPIGVTLLRWTSPRRQRFPV